VLTTQLSISVPIAGSIIDRDCVHQSPAVTNEEQKLLALVFLFRPAEKNRLVKKVLLEKEGQKQTAVQKSTIEEENVLLVCYTCFWGRSSPRRNCLSTMRRTTSCGECFMEGCSEASSRKKSELMFKNTKAFSGFSVNDIQKAKEFYGQSPML
jgi:hypothetical protein